MVMVGKSSALPPHAFAEALRQVASEQLRQCELNGPRTAPAGRFHAKTILVSRRSAVPDLVAARAYEEVEAGGRPDNRVPALRAALQALEAGLASASLPVAEIKRLRRVVAAAVHPDLHQGADQHCAEEVMKCANMLISAALGKR